MQGDLPLLFVVATPSSPIPKRSKGGLADGQTFTAYYMSVNITVRADAATAAEALQTFTQTVSAGLATLDARGKQAAASLAAVETVSARAVGTGAAVAAANARTAASLQAVAASSQQAAAGLATMDAAGKKAAVSSDGIGARILENNRKLKSAIGGLALNATLFAGPQASQFIYPLVLMQKELKGLSSAAKIAGLTIPGVGVAIAGVSALVSIGVSGWKAYQAGVEQTKSELALLEQQLNLITRDKKLIEVNVALGRISEAEGKRLTGVLDDAVKADAAKQKQTPLSQYGIGGLPTAVGVRNRSAIRSVMEGYGYSRPVAQQQSIQAAHDEVKAAIDKVNLTAEELKQLEDLRDKTRQMHIASMEGYAKERAAEEERYRLEERRIKELSKGLKGIDQQKILSAQISNAILKQRTQENIELRETEELLKSIVEMEKEMDERLEKEWDESVRGARDKVDARVSQIQSDPFLTDAEKYNQLKELDPSSVQGIANPESYFEQMRAGLASLSNQWGTLQQEIAGTFYGAINNSINLVSDGLTDMIFQTEGWKQKLAQIPQQILQGIIGAIIQMGLKWMATQLMMAIFGDAMKSKEVIAGVATAKALEEAYAPAAYAAAVASYGGAAYAGAAAVIGGLISTKLAFASDGYKKGGWTGNGGTDQVVGLVHGQEWVMPAETVAAWGHENMAAIQAGPGRVQSRHASNSGDGAIKERQQAIIYLVDNEAQVRRVMESHIGDEIIVKKVLANKTAMGLR